MPLVLRWVDPLGTVHLWQLGAGETLCGRDTAMHTDVLSTRCCPECWQAFGVPIPRQTGRHF